MSKRLSSYERNDLMLIANKGDMGETPKLPVLNSRCYMDISKFSDDEKIEISMGLIYSESFHKMRLIIKYWEDDDRIQKIVRNHHIATVNTIRRYDGNPNMPGVIVITFRDTEVNFSFIQAIMFSHFDFDNFKESGLAMDLYALLSCEDRLLALHYVDDSVVVRICLGNSEN